MGDSDPGVDSHQHLMLPGSMDPESDIVLHHRGGDLSLAYSSSCQSGPQDHHHYDDQSDVGNDGAQRKVVGR